MRRAAAYTDTDTTDPDAKGYRSKLNVPARRDIRLEAMAAAFFAMLVIALSAAHFSGELTVYAASSGKPSLDAKAAVSAQGGANLRSEASVNSTSVAILADGTKIILHREVFTDKKSTSAANRWYYVTAGSRKGYIRSDLVSGISYSTASATAADALNYRKGAGTDMKRAGVIPKGQSLTVTLPAVQLNDNYSWYRISLGSKIFYVCGDWLDFSGKTAQAPSQPAVSISGESLPNALYIGQGFGISGKITSDKKIKYVRIGVSRKNGKWVFSRRFKVNGRSFDVSSADSKIRFGGLKAGRYRYMIKARSGKKTYTLVDKSFRVMKDRFAAGLLANPTNGGKARIIGTLSEENCRRRFSVTGEGSAVVPQGLAYTGSSYYVIFGMDFTKQAIVKYSAKGKRLSANTLPNMGHPNGLTWDPETGKCYIFKGFMYKCYTWDPKTGDFGKTPTPYSSSGVAYDRKTHKMYVSSRTGIRVYSGDGRFTHEALFSRCDHGIFHYVQDCGAGSGFVFHGVSGANKHSTNYLDVYRASDYKYLGSFKITLGEIESVVVNKKGYVELLVNRPGTPDYIWKTPINVKKLKM